jgi:hypothetical protein
MANEPVTEPLDTDLPEKLLQPGDEGSLADILEKDREQRIAIHAGVESPDPDAPEVPEVPETPETPETVLVPETPTVPEKLVEGAPPEKKYKSWEEAEAGARETQRFATEKAEEAKQAREELAVLRQKLADKEKPGEPDKSAEPDKTAEQLEAEEEDRIAKALDEIDGIAEDDPDYKRKVAKAWRKAKLGGANGSTKAISEEALAEMVDRQVEKRLAVKEAETVQQRQEKEHSRTRSTAAELATKAGLQGVTDDPAALGTADHIMFWAVAKGVPEELQSQPIEAQVEWTTAEVRRRKGEVVQTTEAERERARLAQNNNTVMGRGTTQPRKAVEPETFSLGGVLNEVQEERKQTARSRRI